MNTSWTESVQHALGVAGRLYNCLQEVYVNSTGLLGSNCLAKTRLTMYSNGSINSMTNFSCCWNYVGLQSYDFFANSLGFHYLPFKLAFNFYSMLKCNVHYCFNYPMSMLFMRKKKLHKQEIRLEDFKTPKDSLKNNSGT